MRFRHQDATPVLAFLRAHPCRIERLEWEREPVTGGFAFLPQTLKRRSAHEAETNSTAAGRPLALVEAVVTVEAEGAPEEFVLAGHPDGGLISVSRHHLPFQDGLQPITWWGP